MKKVILPLIYVVSIAIIITLLFIHTIYKDLVFFQEANDFKYELIIHQDALIKYQRKMIDNVTDHLWNEHNCDIPDFDGDVMYDIAREQSIIDSLYNTQL